MAHGQQNKWCVVAKGFVVLIKLVFSDIVNTFFVRFSVMFGLPLGA